MQTKYLATEPDDQHLLGSQTNNTALAKSRNKYIIIMVILVVLLLGLATFTIYYVVDNENKSSSDSTTTTTVCETAACYKLAGDILKTANFSVDPCNNFWSFTCDGWWNQHNFELTKRSYYASTTKLNIYQGNSYLDSLFYDTDPQLVDHDSVQKAIKFYDSCYSSTVDDEDVETNELILDLISIVNFTINNDSNWDIEESNALNDALSWLTRRQWNDLFILSYNDVYEPFFMQSPNIKPYGGSFNATIWYQLMNDTYISLYQSVFGISLINARQIANDVIEFMSNIANISTTTNGYPTTEQQTVLFQNGDFEILFGDNNYMNYTQLILNTFKVSLSDYNRIENIIYYEPGVVFFNNLRSLIETTSPLTVQYFLFTNIFYHYFNFKDSFIQSRQQDRKEFCFNLNKREFPYVYGWIINQKYFYPQHMSAVEQLIDDIMDIGMTDLVNAAEWMDEWSRQNTLKKVEEMRVFTGIPPMMMDITKIDYFYSNLSFLDDNQGFLYNYDDLLKFDETNFIKTFKNESFDIVGDWPNTFRNPASYNLWLTGINAFYNRGGNWMCITQTYSVEPYFSLDYPMLFNYAALGRTIGHEANHGFDPNGVKHNYNGTQVPIWTNQTYDYYNGLTDCFIAQYHNISIPKSQGYFVNGTRAITENVADNGGMQAAYRAWEIYKETNPKQANIVLPGIDLTTEQLYWFQYGRAWCDTWRDDYWLQYTGVHSPRYARLIGVVQNMPQFADAYNCPVGSPMNPEKKCPLW